MRWRRNRCSVFGGGGIAEVVDAGGVLRASAVDAASSCLTSSTFTSSSFMSSCLTTGVVYGSALTSSMRDGLRSQSGCSRSMGRAENCGRRKHRIN